jgi:hypothetical protein
MKANELRIGNYVLWTELVSLEESPHKVEVSGIFKTGIITKEYGNSRLEEWLLKFGFEKIIKEGNDHFFDEITYELELKGRRLYFNYCDDDFSSSIADSKKVYEDTPNYICLDGHLAKHVHQLQNLYFALTGEELTIKTK